MLVLALGDLHVPHRAIDLPAKFKKLLVPGKIAQVLATGNLASRPVLDFLRAVAPDVVAVRGDLDDFSLPAAAAGDASSYVPSHPLHARVVVHGPIRIGLVHGHQIVPWGNLGALAAVARQLDVDVLVSGHTHAFEALEHEGRFFVNPGSATGAFSLALPPPPLVVQQLQLAATAQVSTDPHTDNIPPSHTDQSDAQSDANANLGAVAIDAAGSAASDTAATISDPAATNASSTSPSEPQPLASTTAAAATTPPLSALVETTPSFVLMDIQGTNIVFYVYKLIDGEVRVEKMDFQKRIQPSTTVLG